MAENQYKKEAKQTSDSGHPVSPAVWITNNLKRFLLLDLIRNFPAAAPVEEKMSAAGNKENSKEVIKQQAAPGMVSSKAKEQKGRFVPSLILQMQGEGVESKRPGRHSSVVEQLIRNKVITTLFSCNFNYLYSAVRVLSAKQTIRKASPR